MRMPSMWNILLRINGFTARLYFANDSWSANTLVSNSKLYICHDVVI